MQIRIRIRIILDPHQSEKLDPEPDPHHSQNSGAVEAQNGAWRAMDAHSGAVGDLQTSGGR